MKPLISIVIPVYNGAQFLAQSLQSCMDQTHQNLEIIVVNDCSTDDSLAIAESFSEKDSRISIITNEMNKKLPASLNVGHKEAKGDYISWTSDDNLYLPTAIESLYNALQTNIKDIAYSNYEMIEQDGNFRRNVTLLPNTHLLLGNTIGASFLYKKDVFKRNNGYNESLHTVEDYDFWLRAYLHSSYINVPENLYKYRIHPGSLTAQLSEKNTDSEKRFETNLLKSYSVFFNTLFSEKREDLALLFFKLSRNKELNIKDLLDNFNFLREDLNFLSRNTSSDDAERLKTSLELKIRQNLHIFKTNQNFKTLAAVLKKYPKLLTGYDRKRSLKYIVSCFN